MKTIFKRFKSFGTLMLIVSVLMSTLSTTVLAQTSDGIDKMPYGTSVTYNPKTGEILYGADQHSHSNTVALDERNVPATYGLIGKDNRVKINNTTDSPYRTICYVEATYPDGAVSQGSGVLVYFNVMLTAGHIVYEREHGGWATSIRVYPGKNGDNNPLGSATSTTITTNNAWISNCDHEWDWGIVDLSRKFDTWQLYGYYKNYSSQLGEQVQAIGYPGTYMYSDTNSISGIGDRYMHTLCDWTAGESGGAIIDVKTNHLIGIMSYEHTENGQCTYNGAVRINEDLFNRLNGHQSEVSK